MRDERKAVLSCKMIPDEDDESRVKMEITMEGSVNSLLNAYEHITTHLLRQLAEDCGATAAKALYAKVQVDALEAAGVGFKEDVEGIKKRAALMSILGKTFHVGGDE